MTRKDEKGLSASSLVFANVADIKISIEKVLNRKLGNHSENMAVFQKVMNMHAANEPEFKKYNFDPDQRLYELMTTLSAYSVLKKNTPYPDRIRICWQKAGEKSNVENISDGKSQTVDGVFVFFGLDEKDTFLPIEIKSTMCDPNRSITETIDRQIDALISRKQAERGGTPQASIIAVMPYTPEAGGLTVNLERPIKRLQTIADEASLISICLFEVEDNTINITSAVAYGKYYTPNLKDTKKWIRKTVFRAKYNSQ